jgi:hypothetical protein
MEFKTMDEFKTRLNRLAEIADNRNFKSLVDR